MTLIRYLRTPLDLPIALFLVSALIGVWASYDPATSWTKFAMLVTAVALYYGFVALRASPQLLEMFIWLFLFGNVLLVVYFVTQHDFASESGKFGLISSIGSFLNSAAPMLRLHDFHPNIVSGSLEIALPIGIAMLAGQRSSVRNDALTGQFLGVVGCLVIGFGIVMTSSRGAWLALFIVGAAALMLATARDALRRYALPLAIVCVLIAFIVAFQLRDTLPSVLDGLVGKIPAGDTMVSRATVFGQAWGLVQDYNFTGGGLGVFPMVFSTYALLLDVPFLTHAHNLFLQIWLEQGLLGFVAFCWLVVEFYLRMPGSRQSTVDSRQRTADSRQIGLNWLTWGGVAAATVMLLHGMLDVLLYSSRGLPLMLVPIAVAVASQQSTVDSRETTEHRTQITEGRGQEAEGTTEITEHRVQSTEGEKQARNLEFGTWNLKLGVALLIVFGLLLSSFILRPSSFIAMWYANLGSVEQTRVELGQYRWPDRLVEKVRKDCGLRTADCALAPAERYLNQALLIDPGNVTANQRLGTIALTQGSFGYAQSALRNAYQRDPANSLTQRLMAKIR
jgi:O-antigen ligase